MKIECDKCGAKYSIADEKVRGKTFKIRCKKCSNVIIVRDKAAAAAAGAAAAAPAAEEPPGWHLAVDGQTLGPVSEDEVRAKYSAGEIDKETSVWQEGFEDWVTLGSVSTFADLPDQAPMAAAAPAAADDPFGSSGDDAFSAGDFGGGGGGGLGGGMSAPAEPASPRVSSLTGQRNENSVLFSLENLQALATGGGGGGGGGGGASAPSGGGGGGGFGGGGLGSPSTSAPTSEGSGLIDIRAMGAMLGGSGDSGGGGGLASPSGGDEAPAALPSFGGGGFGGLSAAPLVTEAPAAAEVAAPVEEKKGNQGLLIAMVALMFLGLIGLGAYILLKEDKGPEVIVKEVQVPGSTDDKGDKEDKDEKDEDGDEKDSDAEAATGATGATGASGATGEETPTKTTKKRRTGTKKTTKSSGTSGSGSSGTGTTPTGEVPAPTKTTKSSGSGGDVSVDCLLDPSKCKTGSTTTKKTTTTGSSSGPEKLSATDIKAGITSAVKSKAAACGPKNGAAPGTKVSIKFSISGSSGKVSSASATGAHAGTALGKCVEAAAKTASFKQFQASSQGFTYKFKM